MKKALMIMVFAGGVLTITAKGQERLKMEVGYNISAPLGSFKSNYISDPSFRGVTGEISYPIHPKFSLGLHLGYQSYYQKYERDIYKTGPNETTSAVVTNTMEILPVLLRGTYFPKGGSKTIQPYLSAGAGINMVTYSQYLGQFAESEVSVPIAAQAGAGVVFPIGRFNQSGIKLGATYNFATYNKNNISGLSSIGANAGVVFNLR